MHLDDERIQRLLHDELGAVETETRLHLESCAACRRLVDGARADEEGIFALLARLDHPIVELDPRVVLAGQPAARGQWGRRAAAVILGVAIAGAAYALPGSPLPAALDRLLGTGAGGNDRAPATQADSVATSHAGIAVPAADGLVIEIVAKGAGGLATIELTEGEEVVVRAAGGSATFSSDPGRLTVRSSGAVRLEIGIPHKAASVEVLAGSKPVFRKLAGGPISPTPPDSAGRYTIPLPPP